MDYKKVQDVQNLHSCDTLVESRKGKNYDKVHFSTIIKQPSKGSGKKLSKRKKGEKSKLQFGGIIEEQDAENNSQNLS